MHCGDRLQAVSSPRKGPRGRRSGPSLKSSPAEIGVPTTAPAVGARDHRNLPHCLRSRFRWSSLRFLHRQPWPGKGLIPPGSRRSSMRRPLRLPGRSKWPSGRRHRSRPSLNRDSPDGHHHRHRRCRSETRRSTGRVPEAAILTVKLDRRCFHAPRHLVAAGSAGLRRMALPSTAAIIWLPPVMSPAWVTHAAGRSGAGSRRTAPSARRPRPAGRRRSGRAARSVAPILTSFSRKVVSDQCLDLLGQGQRAQEVGEIVGEREELEPHRVVAEGMAGQPRPAQRQLALLDNDMDASR